jgi:hypothetical protein
MRAACVVVALLGLSACTEDDQRYLLTYDHPKAASPVAAVSAAPQPARDTALFSQTKARPAAAPTQSVPVAREAIIEAPPAAENPEQDSGAGSTAEISPADTTPPPPQVTPPDIPSAQRASPPAPAPARDSGQSLATTQAPPVPLVVKSPPPAPVPASAPQGILLKRPPVNAAVPSLSPGPLDTRRPVPAMVRPAPPPVDTAPTQPASPPPVQMTVGVAVSTAAGTSVAATTAPAAPQPPAHSERDAAHCKAVADQRALDAVSNGYDSEMEQQIFAGTYRNCMSWAAQHR